jgi:hypothetical protein
VLLFLWLSTTAITGVVLAIAAAAAVSTNVAWLIHAFVVYSLLALGDLLHHVWKIEASVRAGDLPRAGEFAAEAIGVAQRKADRLAECHASLVAADVHLKRSGPQHSEEARRLLNRSNALIGETGAKVFEPMMLRVRAEAGGKKGLAGPPPS